MKNIPIEKDGTAYADADADDEGGGPGTNDENLKMSDEVG